METGPQSSTRWPTWWVVGNQVPRYSGWKRKTKLPLGCFYSHWLGTKYRDIADGNLVEGDSAHCVNPLVGNQVPRYSGWKPFALSIGKVANVIVVGNQVPRYSGWKLFQKVFSPPLPRWLETKYRDIADGNVAD